MAYRKRVPQLRPCAVCGAPILTAHQRRCYCSGACNTHAWRLRHPDAAPTRATRPSAGLPAEPTQAETAASDVALAGVQPTTLGQPAGTSAPAAAHPPAGPSFGKLVAATSSVRCSPTQSSTW